MTSRGGSYTTLSNNSAGKKKKKKGNGTREKGGESVVVVVVTARGTSVCVWSTDLALSPLLKRVYTNPFSRVLLLFKRKIFSFSTTRGRDLRFGRVNFHSGIFVWDDAPTKTRRRFAENELLDMCVVWERVVQRRRRFANPMASIDTRLISGRVCVLTSPHDGYNLYYEFDYS